MRPSLDQMLETARKVIAATLARRAAWLSPADREDVLQTISLRLARAISGEKEVEYPASYFVEAAINATLDELRRRERRPEIPVSQIDSSERVHAAMVDCESPARRAELSELRAQIEAVLVELERRSRQRASIVRLYLMGASPAEIGRALALSEGSVRNGLHRGLGDLRNALAKQGVAPARFHTDA